jgi:hypothetical protein
MESIVGTRTKRSLDVALKSAFRGGALSAPRTGAWRQRLVNLTLVFSDVVFALFTWGIACIAAILWVPGHLSGEMVLSAVPITLAWVWGKPVIILGDEDSGVRLEESLVQEWALGFKPIALFDGHQEDWPVEGHEGGERRIDGDVLEEAVELGKKHRIDTIFLAMPRAPREYLAKLADAAGVHFRSVVVIPDLGGGISDSIAVVRNLAGTLGMEVDTTYSTMGPKVQACTGSYRGLVRRFAHQFSIALRATTM